MPSGVQKDKKPDLVVTESAIDALSYIQLSDTNQNHPNGVMAVSTAGVRATVNKRITNLLPQVDRVVIAYDNDEAGQSFGAKLGRAIKNIFQGAVRLFQLPAGCKDVNDLLQSQRKPKPTREAAPEPDDVSDDYDTGLSM